MNIGIIGTGNIATYLLEQVNSKYMTSGRITAVFGRKQKAGHRLSEQFSADFYTDFQAFMKSS